MIRESTGQTNKRVAEQMEAAERRHSPRVKWESAIDRPSNPERVAERYFLPFVRATFKEKRNTRCYYELGAKSLLAFGKLAEAELDKITGETIAGYVAKRQHDGLAVSSINRELQALRRMSPLPSNGGKRTRRYAACV